jgi:multicomponent Na+:H+ antiporter subunit G
VRAVISDVFLWIGVAFNMIACLGVLVMRDTLERLHYTGPSVLGAISIAVAVVVKDSFSLTGDKAILIAVFLIIASPIVTHAAARASRIARTGDWRPSEAENVEVEQQ